MTDGAERHELVGRFRRARADPTRAVLEGFHPVKHALRFGADVLAVVCRDVPGLHALARDLAPDLADELRRRARQVDQEILEELVPVAPHTGVVAVARRPVVPIGGILGSAPPVAADAAPVVLLDRPVHLGNLGACVRAAAAAGAAGLLSLGPHDPWHPDAIRGAAGLQFAIPVGRADLVSELPSHGRPLVALDPAGEPLEPGTLAAGALLAFGGERSGLAPEILETATRRVRIPMRPGVSSLNLATAVAVALYAWRWASGVGDPGAQ